ncbi:PREDICTED: probable glycosyltransferase At5g03795 [Theobroma cacao]|uniref:Probable glycosyltransferase At5g03795 n=1 Tax=Theobroma cacao TaxID=3641 RepID=A0AB32V3T4_THECC|nr:PREDICTED: probable glycosyltransferase At5g03795 [Theobroma cacao]
MGDGNKNCFACCFSTTTTTSSSSSIKLLFFIVPLILVSFFVFILVPKNSTWVLISSLPPSSSSAAAAASNGSEKDGAVAHAEGSEKVLDLRSRVGTVDVHGSLEEAALSDEAALNRPASPPLAVEAVTQIQELNETKEESLNISIPDSDRLNTSMTGIQNTTTPRNESIALPLNQSRQVRTKLDKLEAGLQRARAAIKEAKNGSLLQDPDYVPIGPMYWDAKAFHRSYLEMEKQFKIFVYKEGEPPVFHDGPCKSIYSMEGNFIHKMDVDSNFQTKDPEKAHVFYLPFSVAKMVRFVYLRDSRDFSPIRRTVVDYVNLIAEKYPYWNRSLGADHFMLACHDWGPEASFSLPYLQKNSIRALCNANTSEKFNPVKDVSIPEINLLTGKLTGLIGGPSASRRPILAFFAGGVHGPIRPILLEHWEGKDEDIRVHKYLPKGVNYYEMMKNSKYCICPSGYEVASPRIVEALYNGCVPVLISKSYVPPFSDVLRWKSFSVVVSVDDIPKLKEILTKISSRQYIRMQRRVLQVRRHFAFNSPPKRFDVFHMILHSVWLRRLNVRISDDHGVMPN